MTSTIKDIMQSTIDTNAEGVWHAVAIVATPTGIEDRAPRDNDEWRAVRHHAVTLLEATNLIIMPGRIVARPGEKSDNPNIELEPGQIQSLIDLDRRAWTTFAGLLHDATVEALTAIDAQSPAALLEAGEKIDMACEACHQHYWYPAQRGHERQ